MHAEVSKEAIGFSVEPVAAQSVGLCVQILKCTDFVSDAARMNAVSKLRHNLGILILAITFPDHFREVYKTPADTPRNLLEIEESMVGWDHSKIGAYYLWNHHISEEVVDAVHWHNDPAQAAVNPKLASAIQVSDNLIKQLGVLGMEKTARPVKDSHLQLEGWKILFGDIKNLQIVRSSKKMLRTNKKTITI